ncbi:MAG: hemerythrin domain-containing protein [Candidatus Omnitrophica bacterium]|nr:hemerythrin domain-containing protein [Candidatus Omnitrophota bacterium]
MRAIERLQRDHRVLQAKLNVIETALRMGPEVWPVVREVCCTLARQLHDHIKREEALIAQCRTTLAPQALSAIALEHHDEPEQLQTIKRLFVKGDGRVMERAVPALSEAIQRMRRHMAEEETSLFPLLQRELAGQQPPTPPIAQTSILNECMTVNRVAHEHPATKAVFEHLLIHMPSEGCSCLDEVAWQHGMDSRQLVEELERVIPPHRPRRAKAVERLQQAPECACR